MSRKPRKNGDLRVWHIPQLGSGAVFYVYDVRDVNHALEIIDMLADYDVFQFENDIKPDYCNTSGLEVFENNSWEEYVSYDHEDISEIRRNREIEREESCKHPATE